jgi:hypothetical protein
LDVSKLRDSSDFRTSGSECQALKANDLITQRTELKSHARQNGCKVGRSTRLRITAGLRPSGLALIQRLCEESMVDVRSPGGGAAKMTRNLLQVLILLVSP